MAVVKTYPDLNAAALEGPKRCDRELAIWYLLRFLDPEGNGWVARTQLIDLIERHRLMSVPNLKRRLRRGEGTFWDSDLDRIRYRSLAKLCGALGVIPERLPVAVPLDAFGSLGRLRAFLYATWLNQSSNPISRETIERITGVKKQTQIRYEKSASVRREKNMATKRYERGDQISAGGFLSRDGKTVNLPMANTYRPGLEQLLRGQLKQARRIVRGLQKGRPNGTIRRCYFRTGKEARKCKDRAESYFVDQGRSWKGRRLWEWCGA